MAKPIYRITDMDALEKACPKAVETIKTINRVKLTRLWNAARDMGMTIPGVEASDAVEDIPAHIAIKAAEQKA